jgi:hypothetical protein
MARPIDCFLIIWAEWSVYRIDSGLGYAPVTPIGRCIELGPAGAASRRTYGSHTIPGNETAEALDRLVAALPADLHRVVKLEYLSPGSQRQKAKRLHLTYDCFRGRLRLAKAQLAASL